MLMLLVCSSAHIRLSNYIVRLTHSHISHA